MDLEKLVEAKLREAREQGDFNPAKRDGKVLVEDDPNVPEDQRLMQHILRHNNIAPDWIETDKALRKRIDDARAALRRSYDWRRQKLVHVPDTAETQRIEAEWARAQKRFSAELEAINRDVFAFNLKTPVAQIQRRPLRLSEEMERLKHAPRSAGAAPA